MTTPDRRNPSRFVPVLLAGAALAWLLSGSPLAVFLDRAAYDRLLALTGPIQADTPVTVIGVDAAALDRFPEPVALWHPHWADVLDGVTRSGVRGLAMDLVFAISLERIAPELDQRLMAALESAKTRRVPVHLGMATGPFAGMPHPKFAIFASGLGYLNLSADADEVVRRHVAMQTNADGKRILSLSRLLTDPALGSDARDRAEIYIDYRLPAPPIHSFAEVHQWIAEGWTDRLSGAFENRFVLLGFQSAMLQDLHPVPRPIVSSDPPLLSGLMIHARIAQTLLAGHLLRDAPVDGPSGCRSSWEPSRPPRFSGGRPLPRRPFRDAPF